MSVRSLTGALVAASLLLPSVAAAQGVPDFFTARAIGFAGTRSLASSVEGIFLNPASLPLTSQYLLQLDYGHDAAPSSQLSSGNGLVLSILDSKTNPRFAVGASYRYVSLTENGAQQQGSVYDTALGVMIFPQLSLGIHLEYLSYTSGSQSVSNITGDVGLLVPLGPISINATGFNLIEVQSPEAPRGFDTGIAAGDMQHVFRMGFDYSREWPYKAVPYNQYNVGLEIMIAQMVPVRAGLLWDNVTADVANPKTAIPLYVTAGTGFYFKIIGVDVSYRRNLQNNASSWVFAAKLFTG